MADFITLAVVLLVVAAAVTYIVKEKKKGNAYGLYQENAGSAGGQRQDAAADRRGFGNVPNDVRSLRAGGERNAHQASGEAL